MHFSNDEPENEWANTKEPDNDLQEEALSNAENSLPEEAPEELSATVFYEPVGSIGNNGEIKQKSKKTLYAIAAFVVAALIITVTVVAMVIGSDPVKTVNAARSNNAKDFEELRENAALNVEAVPFTITPKTAAEFSITVNNIQSSAGLPLFALSGAKLSGSVNIDETVRKAEAALSAELRNEKLMDVFINLDDTYLSIFSPEIYSKYVTADLKTLQKDYDSSIISMLLGNMGFYGADTFPDQLFSLSSLNAEYKETQSKYLAELTELSGQIDNAMKNPELLSEISRGKQQEVGDYKCAEFTAVISEEAAAQTWSEIINNVRDFMFNNQQMMESGSVSGEDVFMALSSLENLTISGPIEVKYYIDKNNKIRRAVQTGKIAGSDSELEFTVDLSYEGKNNAFDSVKGFVEFKESDVQGIIEIAMEGNNGDPEAFSNSSKFTFKSGTEGTVPEVFAVVNYSIDTVKAAKHVDMHLDVEDYTNNNNVSFDIKGTVDIDPKVGIMFYDLTDVSLKAGAESFSGSLYLDLRPGTAEPASRTSLETFELLKSSEMELMMISQEVYNNVEALQNKIMSALGL